MATNVAPPKNTGGGGFVFEDDVCAWLLACLLSGESVLDPELGSPIRVDFQTRADGWFLDDALVTTVVGAVQYRFAVSIKSNAQFTASAAPDDFVMCAWEHWLQIGSTVFQPTHDYMGLVTAPISAAARASLSGLTEKARTADPALFPGRLATPNWASEDERVLFSSFRCPTLPGARATVTPVDTARLLQRLRFLQHDFGPATSESRKRALGLCRNCVRGHSAQDAETLWNLLRSVAAEFRPLAGSITLRDLIERVRRQIPLADYPDHAADWVTLDARSQDEAAQVPDSIAGRIHIPRHASVDVLAGAVASDHLVALLGASGGGKSAMAKALFGRRRASGERTLWLDARSLDRVDLGAFESTLRLRYQLRDLLPDVTSGDPLLVLDGLDRLYSDNAFRNAAALLLLARPEAPGTRWRVLAPCQLHEWPRVVDAIQRAGAPQGTWKQVQLEPLTVADLAPVGDSTPALKHLLLQRKVGPLLTNLKLLDLVAHRANAGADVVSATWVGESSVADWFWSAEIDRGAERIARGRFARALAQRQADELVASVPTDDFDVGDLAPLPSLAADQLCVQLPGDRIAFAHDLYGDWARLRILLNHRSDLPAFFLHRRASPLWHRALRLLGIHLLEHSAGVEDWRAALLSFGQGGLSVLHDVLLEAPVFAVNARALLNAVLPDLQANDGVLLRRLLTRFLAFGTVPDPDKLGVALAVGVDVNVARATYRLPYWPYWLDVLAFLHEHRATVLSAAPCELARIVEMWMAFAPKGTVRRAEVAELAVLLGRHGLGTRKVHGGREWQRERQRFYACALAAAHERADDVAAIALAAAERVPSSNDAGRSPSTPARQRRGIFGEARVMREPWPDGPRARVDEAFQKAVLNGAAITDLYRERPSVAREIVLATLIQGPTEEDWKDQWMDRRDLQIVNHHGWLPALYTHGPFFSSLRENFAEGLELIAGLVEFAATRAGERIQREADGWCARAKAEGRTEAEIAEALREALAPEVVLLEGSQERSFPGDERMYGWSAGLGNPPYAVQSALMALEQYFYQRIDEGEDVATETAAVLARSESVALLGVLCDVGKRHRVLFEGPLQALLSGPALYAWEIGKMVQGRGHLMIGAVDKGAWFIELARSFHALEHRKSDLRNIATVLMLQRPAMQEYFARTRELWKAAPASDSRVSELTRQLLVSLDPANYEMKNDPEHGVVLINVEALRVQEARADERRAMDDHMVVTSLPMRCRTILDERQELNATQLAGLWDQWGRVRNLSCGVEPANGEKRFGDEYANAIAGGVAVFLRHDEWCAEDASRLPELVAALRGVMNVPPEARAFDTDDSISTWTWECFAAEAAAILWSRAPNDQEWRRFVGGAVFCRKYAVVTVLFSRCAEFRALLGDDFGRLRRLALDWAHIRDRAELLRLPHEALELEAEVPERVQRELDAWSDEKLGAFVAGTSSGMPADWKECDNKDRFRDLDGVRQRWPTYRDMNLHVVRCSHEWLPLPDAAQNEREREDIVRFWRSALSVIVARPLSDLKRQENQFPKEDESWVLTRVGAALLQLRADEQPELLWHGVLDLHSEGHDWPEVLAHSLHRHALRGESVPASYANLVRSLVQHAFVDIEGGRRWSAHERVWDALLGLDWISRDLWEPRHSTVVRDLRDVFLLWMQRVPLNGRRLAGFASWLGRDAAAPMRLQALPWLLAMVRPEGKRELREVEEAEDPIASLLNVLWPAEESSLRSDPTAFAAFRGLLLWLADRQNHLGLELLGRLGSLA